MPTERTILASCLVGLIVSLFLVGIVSSTLIRHSVQVIPAVLALAAVARNRTWAACAALPVFIFWLLVMLAIWLFLVGVARVVSGEFTRAEVVLTVLIGISSICGIATWIRSRSQATIAKRVSAFVLLAVLQVGAMWLSFQQPFVNQ